MAAHSPFPTAGSPARAPRLGRGLRAAGLLAILVCCPGLVRSAVAQRPAGIRASAYVSTSVMAVAVRPDTAARAARATARIRVAGVGMLDVQCGPGGQVRVSTEAVAREEPTVVVQVLNFGS